jgi:hypothetical protein
MFELAAQPFAQPFKLNWNQMWSNCEKCSTEQVSVLQLLNSQFKRTAGVGASVPVDRN